jgi:hypothetical protein
VRHASGDAAHRAPRLRTSLRGRVRSSEGWSVVVVDRLTIRYSDAAGDVNVSAEARGGRRTGFELYAESMAHLPRERADLVVARVREAFAHAGWHLRVDG